MSRTSTGPTPAGGDRSVITFLDADNVLVEDQNLAVRAEIVEYDGPHEISRTYMERTPAGQPAAGATVSTDEVLGDPDVHEIIRETWALSYYENGRAHPVATKDDLLRFLHAEEAPLEAQREAVAMVMGWDIWTAAPEHLQREVAGWIEGTRPQVTAQPSQPR